MSVPDNFSGQVSFNNEILIDTEIAPKTRTAILPSTASVVSKDTNTLEVTGTKVGSFNIQSIGRNRFGVSDTLVNIAKVTNIPNYTFEVEQPNVISDTDICKYTVLYNGKEENLPNYPLNSELKIKAETLNNDYEFKGWETFDFSTNTWRANIETSTTLTITLQEDTKVRAVFIQVPKYNLNLSQRDGVTYKVYANGSATATKSRIFKRGTNLRIEYTITNTDQLDYEFVRWNLGTGGTGTVIGNAVAITYLSQDETLFVETNNIRKYKLTLGLTNYGRYEVYKNNVLTSDRIFRTGTSIKVKTIATNNDWGFQKWIGASSTTAEVIITMNNDKDLNAIYVRWRTLTLQNSGGLGNFTKEINGVTTTTATRFLDGTVVKVTSTPAYYNGKTPYTFKNWSEASTGTNNTTTVTMNDNKTLTANYTTQNSTIRIAGAQNYENAVWYKVNNNEWYKDINISQKTYTVPRYSPVELRLMGQLHQNFSFEPSSGSITTTQNFNADDLSYTFTIFEHPER